MPRARRAVRSVPRVSSPSYTLELDDYSAGMNPYIGNDKFPVRNAGTNMWRLAQNARIITQGEYETRKGIDFHSAAVGETKDDFQETTTGANNRSISETIWGAQKFTSTQDAPLSRFEVGLGKETQAQGTVLVELWTDDSGEPGAMISRSSIAGNTVIPSYAYTSAYFPDAPMLVNGTDYWIVIKIQPSGFDIYGWSSTTAATDSLSSLDSGNTWSANSYALNFKEYYATTGGVKGLIRAVKSDGTKVTIFAHGTAVYTVDNVTGAVTAIKTGLSANATHYRFVLVNDIVYYVNGQDGYRKWDFTTESQVTATNYSDIVNHKGLNVLVRVDDPARFDWTGFGLYETFASVDFMYVPSPKTGDSIASMTSLNGYLLVRTRNRAYIVSGSGDPNADSFSLDLAPDQKGTYSPETSCTDKNFEYFLSDDGIYRSNGTQPELISENVYQDIVSMTNKDDVCMAINKGRLYVWFTSAGSDTNDSCYVLNLNFKNGSDTVESLDTNTFVSRAVSSWQDDDTLLVGSSRLGQVYWQELETNDYTNLGGDIDFELRTHYFVGSNPSVYKAFRYWQVRFGAADGNYTINCDYAYDLRDNWVTYSAPDVQGVGSIWGAGQVWGAFTWGATHEVNISTYVPGEYRRIALRYTHYATRQPHRFFGQTIRYQERRMR